MREEIHLLAPLLCTFCGEVLSNELLRVYTIMLPEG